MSNRVPVPLVKTLNKDLIAPSVDILVRAVRGSAASVGDSA